MEKYLIKLSRLIGLSAQGSLFPFMAVFCATVLPIVALIAPMMFGISVGASDGAMNGIVVFTLLFPLIMLSLDTMKKMEEMVVQIRDSVKYDGMTRVLSRSYFMDILRNCKNDGYLLLIDADNFKRINDMHGHAAGDDALIQIANSIEWAAGGDSFVGRLGGEEFAVYLPNASYSFAAQCAEAIRSRVMRYPILFSGTEITLSVSIGGVKRNAGEPLRDALTPADRCMYQAKAAGKNRVIFA